MPQGSGNLTNYEVSDGCSQATEEHLMILSSLASMFSKQEVCDAIRHAGSKDEIAQIIESAEQ